MKFYHIELAKIDKIKTFIPRVPDCIMSFEDDTTPRICVSTSIEGCLSAAPWGGLSLDNHAIGTLFRVYVFESNNYTTPNVLVEKYGVLDAIANEEYWITEVTTPIDDFLIAIDNYDYGSFIMGNGKEHTMIEKLDYHIVKNEDTGNIIDLSNYKEETYYYEIIELIIESYFLENGIFIDDFMDSVKFKNNHMYIEDKYLFYKGLFYKIIKDKEEMKLFYESLDFRFERNKKIS